MTRSKIGAMSVDDASPQTAIIILPRTKTGFDQRVVFSNCGAKYDADKFKVQLETVYTCVESNDKHAVTKGKI